MYYEERNFRKKELLEEKNISHIYGLSFQICENILTFPIGIEKISLFNRIRKEQEYERTVFGKNIL